MRANIGLQALVALALVDLELVDRALVDRGVDKVV